MKRVLWLYSLLLSAWIAPAFAYEACGELGNAYGPIDYRKATNDQKQLVEGAHFLPWVESLTRGNTSSTPGGDIDYTLRAFPNHPRALLAMMKLAAREGTDKPRGSRYSVDCWFDRAIRFQSDDGAVHMLYGTFLARRGKNKEAIQELETASSLLGDQDGNAHYNLGLAYTEMKQYDKALTHAHKAYALGFDLPGLRNKLERAGKWKPLPATAKPSAPPHPEPVKAETPPEPKLPDAPTYIEGAVKPEAPATPVTAPDANPSSSPQ